MQPIDPNTLFSIFEQGDEAVYKENGVEDILENPYVLLGMVIRGLENYQLIDTMYLRSYKEEYVKIRDNVKLKYYNGLYKYLTRLDSKKFETIYSISDAFDTQQVLYGLSTLLLFYEELEEYEKCAVIKNYIDLVHYSTQEFEKRRSNIDRIPL